MLSALKIAYFILDFVLTLESLNDMEYSACAGGLTAVASLFGKLAADDSTEILQKATEYCINSDATILGYDTMTYCPIVTSAMRLVFLGIMLSLNGVMISCFIKGMQNTDSITATVTSAACNFISSAIIGNLFLKEELPLMWWLGASIILVGMKLLLTKSPSSKNKKE